MATTVANITAGPSTFELLISLSRKGFGLYDTDPAKTTAVQFTADGNNLSSGFYAAISSMRREDGSGESWNLIGNLVDRTGLNNMSFTAYYNARTRKGRITIQHAG